MAAVKKVKPVNPHHLTAKQLAADRANLKKARAVAAQKTRTGKQRAASRRNLVKARAAQNARRSGAAKKKPQAPLDTGDWLHALPVCGPVAIAAHLQYWTGAIASAGMIWDLAMKTFQLPALADLLEYVMAEGFASMKLESFWSCQLEEPVEGLLYGISHPAGYHAVLAVPGGMASWGRILPYEGEPAEAWHLEWSGQ
jgi:hypothetical protein